MYILSVLAQDEETQRKGCVGISLNIEPFWIPAESAHYFRFANLVGNLAPVRYVSYHFCIDDPLKAMMISNLGAILSATANKITRCVRFRIHSGTSNSLGSWTFGLDFVCFY
jgi:hypothetical protein